MLIGTHQKVIFALRVHAVLAKIGRVASEGRHSRIN